MGVGEELRAERTLITASYDLQFSSSGFTFAGKRESG